MDTDTQKIYNKLIGEEYNRRVNLIWMWIKQEKITKKQFTLLIEAGILQTLY